MTDDDQDGTTPEAAPAATETEDVAALRSALEERENRYTRLAADFENHRRRTAREYGERLRYASEEASLALLPVLDSLVRAVAQAPEGTPPAMLDGLERTVRQFEEALAGIGVTPIEAEGADFDPTLHEAVMGEESSEVERDTVVQELRRGWRLHDRVLRPSMVRVAHPAAGA